jgi:4-amino-4-deoxy-L-arabinose transferase-like glycosyltransferase
VNQPTPAIVSQAAVRRLPRVALLLFCLAYVLPGFVGREPWKTADITAFGFMAELARGASDWLAPTLIGLPPDVDALMPYWLGAWAIQIAPAGIAQDFAARVPFILLLALTLFATWYGTYCLARSPQAQPVAFAFGGEALPPDYARAVADGGLLAFIACLGLAQLSHETTPAQVQLCCTALTFYALSAMPYRTVTPVLTGVAGLIGLTLSGAPAMAVLFGAGGAAVHLLDRSITPGGTNRRRAWAWGMVLLTLGIAALATVLGLWHWRIEIPEAAWDKWSSLARLLLWFTWPAWPLALWTLWRWRRQIVRGDLSRHMGIPLWFVAVSVCTTLATSSSDRSLLLALPALAALAAFALPTLERSVAALIDWFTLLFFSGSAFIIWVIWIAMQTGVPKQPAANITRLAPGFEPGFSITPFLIALTATLAWAWLVKWRAGRHRSAIWKSLVLPAGGAALCWLLLMTLWLPLLNYARSYAPMMSQVLPVLAPGACVEFRGLSLSQIAALQFYVPLGARRTIGAPGCQWMLVDRDATGALPINLDLTQWDLHSTVRHPIDKDENLLLYKRSGLSRP